MKFSAVELANMFASKISKELNLDNNNKEVIEYGFFAIIQMVYNIAIIIMVAAIFNVIPEALIVSFVIAILRKSSGGAHANRPWICTTIGTLVAVGFGILSKINISMDSFIVCTIIIFSYGYYVLYKLAPVDSAAKPIKTDKKKKRLKKSSIIILSIYLVIVMCNTILHYLYKIDILFIYSVCILYGIMWQVLSLTKIGHRIVKLIEVFFYKLQTYKL